jgi:hypothetical protein
MVAERLECSSGGWLVQGGGQLAEQAFEGTFGLNDELVSDGMRPRPSNGWIWTER